jgi:hypothetical protein
VKSGEGVELLGTYFREQPTRQGLLARRLLGRSTADDEGLASRLQDGWAAELRKDGSASGSVIATAWRIVEITDLGGTPPPGLAAWLLEQQDQPGRFGEGCSRPRHAARMCEHYIEGFFAVAGPSERVAPLTLPVGRVIRSESAARFAGSCLALRGVMLAGHGARPGVTKHLDFVAGIAALEQLPSDYITMEMVAVALSVLAHCGRGEAGRTQSLVDLMAERQRGDGTWSGLDLFLALEALLAVQSDAAGQVIRRAVPALLVAQRRDGTFGALARQERAWIGLQALTFQP